MLLDAHIADLHLHLTPQVPGSGTVIQTAVDVLLLIKRNMSAVLLTTRVNEDGQSKLTLDSLRHLDSCKSASLGCDLAQQLSTGYQYTPRYMLLHSIGVLISHPLLPLPHHSLLDG